MKTIKKMCFTLGVCTLLSAAVTAKGNGVTFYTGTNYGGSASQQFDYGNYTLSQMVAKGCPNDTAKSVKFTNPYAGDNNGYVVVTYLDDNFSGYASAYAEQYTDLPGNMSSLKVLNYVPNGYVWRSGAGQFVEMVPGYLFGMWLLFHNGDYVYLSGNGNAHYTARYEVEYWIHTGNIVQPTRQVISGSNVLDHTGGTAGQGGCTGTGFPYEGYYVLNGQVYWKNNESGCSYNISLREQGW